MWIFLPASPTVSVRWFSIFVWTSSSPSASVNAPASCSSRICASSLRSAFTSSPDRTPMRCSIDRVRHRSPDIGGHEAVIEDRVVADLVPLREGVELVILLPEFRAGRRHSGISLYWCTAARRLPAGVALGEQFEWQARAPARRGRTSADRTIATGSSAPPGSRAMRATGG